MKACKASRCWSETLSRGSSILEGSSRLVPDGMYHLLAAALPPFADTLGYLLPDSANLLVGAWNGPVIVRQGRASGPFIISLRPMTLTGPPLLVSLPFVLADTLK
jgi:hypothetical protein